MNTSCSIRRRWPCASATACLVLILSQAMSLLALDTNIIRRSLSLRDCLLLSLEHNLDLRIQRYAPRIADFRLRALRGAYDPVFSVFAKRNFLDQPARVNADNLRRQSFINDQGVPYTVTFIDTQNRYEQTVDSVGGGLTGKLPTGLAYELTVLNDRRDITAFPLPGQILPYGQTNDAYASVALTLRQPLLKDFWIDEDQLNLQIARRDLKIAEAELRARMMTNVADVMMAYYEVIFAREAVRVNQKAFDLARQLFLETRRRVQVGELPALAEKQTESMMETMQADIIAAEQVEVEFQNALKLLITDDLAKWIGVTIDPVETLIATSDFIDHQASWAAALINRPDLEGLRLELEKRQVLIRYSRNQLYPSLDLIGGGGLQYYGATGSAAWRRMGDGDQPFYSVGLMLSFPLSRTAARNHHKANLAGHEQAQLRLKKREQKAMAAVDTAAKGVGSALKRVDSTRKARAYAEEALAAEEKKFRSGASTSYLVLEQQRNLTSARTAEIQALADLHKARAQLHLEEGTVLARNHVKVEIH